MNKILLAAVLAASAVISGCTEKQDAHPSVKIVPTIKTRVSGLHLVVFQKVCLDRSLQIPQICKYSDSCFQIHTPRRVDLIFVL